MYIGNKRVLGAFQTIYEDTPTHEASLDVSKNGEYEVTPDEKMALSKVKVNVNVPVVLEDKEITENGTYTASEGFDGIGQVIVNAKLPEQEKTIDITENGTTEIFPDEGYTLSKVTANVNVSASGESKLVQIIEGTITELTAEDLEGVTIIGNGAFTSRPTLKNVTLPDTITSIGNGAFTSSGIERINIPSSVVSIGTNAFSNCSNIQRVDITDLKSWLNINFVGNYGYSETSNPTAVAKGKLYLNGELVTSLVLTEDTPVNSTGFACNLDLKSLSIIGKMSILAYAFYKSGLETANLAKVTTIGNYAFHNCSNLTEVLIGDTVTSIGGYALNVGSANNKATIRFLGTIPPSIQSGTIGNNVEKIIVPVGCGDIYKSATNFSAKADIIEEDAE